MSIATQIDDARSQDPHPIDALIGSAAEFLFVIRNGTRFRWIRSVQEANVESELSYDRLGTNLYNFARNESWGALIDIDGSSHAGKLTPEQLAEVELRRPDYVTLSVPSTSGTGRHWYILWDNPVPCSPDEHRELGVRTSAKLRADVDVPYEFVDTAINMLWRKPGTVTKVQLAPRRELEPFYFPADETNVAPADADGPDLTTDQVDGRFRTLISRIVEVLSRDDVDGMRSAPGPAQPG